MSSTVIFLIVLASVVIWLLYSKNKQQGQVKPPKYPDISPVVNNLEPPKPFLKTTETKYLSFKNYITFFFLAIIALATEFFLYMSISVSTAMTGRIEAIPAIAIFFVFLMLYTALTALCSLIFAFLLSGNNNASIQKTYKTILGLSLVFMLILGTIIIIAVNSGTEGDKQTESTHKDGLLNEAVLYRDSIEIKNLEVFEGYMGKSGVSGEIKNKGSKEIFYLELIIYALDQGGKSIYEEKYTLINSESFMDDQVLKPNYSKKFSYSFDAPSDWSKQINTTIGELRLEARK